MPVKRKDQLPLYDRIKELLVLETCKYQRTFYACMKTYLSKHSKCLLLSEMEVFERVLDEIHNEFQTTPKILVEEGEDPDASCYYQGLIECIIKECHAPDSVLQHTAMREIRPLWNKMIRKLADSECNYERTFYGNLIWFMSRSLMQSHGCLPLSDVQRINECLHEFESALKMLNDQNNDFDDIRFFNGIIEEVIENSKEKLSLVSNIET